MTTEKQITANRENAKKSTGPRSLDGKCKSRRNAVRHGLTAETVIDVLEDRGDYEALAAAINADYRPATNFEMQLISRLTSLLWRLRRATAIESGLLALEVDVRPSKSTCSNERLCVFCELASSPARPIDCEVGGQAQETAEGCLSVGTRILSGRPKIPALRVHFCGLPLKMGSIWSTFAVMRRACGVKQYKLSFCCTRQAGAVRGVEHVGLTRCA